MCKVCKCTGAPHFWVAPHFWGAPSVADVENFGGGDFKHKTSKIRKISVFGRKITLNFGEDLFFFFFLETIWFWAKKRSEFPFSAEKSPSISVKTFFFLRPPDLGRKKGLNVRFRPVLKWCVKKRAPPFILHRAPPFLRPPLLL